MTLDDATRSALHKALLEDKADLEKQLARFAKKGDCAEGDCYETTFPEDLGSEIGENASEVEQYVGNIALEHSLETQLRDVNDALEKMEQGTYGIDEETGEPIAVERLKAYPAARTNISA